MLQWLLFKSNMSKTRSGRFMNKTHKSHAEVKNKLTPGELDMTSWWYVCSNWAEDTGNHYKKGYCNGKQLKNDFQNVKRMQTVCTNNVKYLTNKCTPLFNLQHDFLQKKVNTVLQSMVFFLTGPCFANLCDAIAVGFF